MTPERTSVLLEDKPWWFGNALHLLNHKEPIERTAMRRLVAAWDDAGRDAAKTVQAVPELRPYLYGESSLPLWGATFETNGSGLRARLVPDDTRLPRPVTRNDTRMRIACVRFVHFLLSESRERLGGPCEWKRCGKYFLQPKGKRRNYCSPICSRLDSATKHTTARRKGAREEKLRVAAELAKKWSTARTKDDWKEWVSKQPAGVKAEITPKFLTRAVNHYGLVEPTKGR